MSSLIIAEIKSDKMEEYKSFFTYALINDGNNFRVSADDDVDGPFPTKDRMDSFTLGAYAGNVLIGVVSFERDGENREKIRHKGTLFRMYISKSFRRQGIAKKLIEALLERVKGISDIEQINLTVISTNVNAKKMYEEFNFVTFASEQNSIKWKGQYFTEDQMALNLKQAISHRHQII